MSTHPRDRASVSLFLGGDVMTGRGIDQILPHPSEPQLFEPFVSSAHEYVELAEHAHGAIAAPLDFNSIWGDTLAALEKARPDVSIVNLETAVTTSDNASSSKEIHYRMHPGNVPCLTAARIDCCALANNHSMDWGRDGLEQTLAALRTAGISPVGAGVNLTAAWMPARFNLPAGGRVLVFACGTADSGIPPEWEATEYRPGVCMLDDLSSYRVGEIAARVREHRLAGDIVVMSLHWGGNWGYEIPSEQRRLAHELIDIAGVDVVHGHSSHHPKGIEVYRNKLILYGCGDLLNDYEGIGGYEHYRPDLGLMYFPRLDAATGDLLSMSMVPTCIRRMRVARANHDDAHWLGSALERAGRKLGTMVHVLADDTLALHWSGHVETAESRQTNRADAATVRSSRAGAVLS